MTHDEAVFEILAHRRNLGTTLDPVWRNVRYRTKDERAKERALEILQRLEQEGEVRAMGDRWFLTRVGLRRAKGSAVPAEWLKEDAWILLAALYSCRREAKSLDALIGAADYINHGIPSLEELHGAINRLLAGRLLKTARGKLIVTERATELLDKAEATGSKRGSGPLRRLRRLLDCPCCGVQLKAVRWGYVLDDEAYAAAVATYRARF